MYTCIYTTRIILTIFVKIHLCHNTEYLLCFHSIQVRLYCVFFFTASCFILLTTAALRSKSVRSWCTAVTPLTHHILLALTLTSNRVTNQRPVHVPPRARGITVTCCKVEQTYNKARTRKKTLAPYHILLNFRDKNRVNTV